jgi:alkylation response protein AidB-like acyl-CoA dehydrogenase
MTQANADETDRLGELAAAGAPADPKYMQLFSARVLVETAYATKWCAEAIELLQRNSGSTAIMDFEPIQRSWRDARIITLHGALNLEALSENYGRLMAGIEPHKVAGITTLDRFAPAAPAAPAEKKS